MNCSPLLSLHHKFVSTCYRPIKHTESRLGLDSLAALPQYSLLAVKAPQNRRIRFAGHNNLDSLGGDHDISHAETRYQGAGCSRANDQFPMSRIDQLCCLKSELRFTKPSLGDGRFQAWITRDLKLA